MVAKIQLLRTLVEGTPIGIVKFSPNGRYLAVQGSREKQVWDVVNNVQVYSTKTDLEY